MAGRDVPVVLRLTAEAGASGSRAKQGSNQPFGTEPVATERNQRLVSTGVARSTTGPAKRLRTLMIGVSARPSAWMADGLPIDACDRV
jgi:hypothetical protein